MATKFKRICIARYGYAVVPGDTNEQALAEAKKLTSTDFDWEDVDEGVLSKAEIVEDCGPYGESL